MAGPAISLSTAQTMLTAYIAAETALLDGKTYVFGDRTLSMSNLDEVQRGRREWTNLVDQLNAAADGNRSLYKLADFRESSTS